MGMVMVEYLMKTKYQNQLTHMGLQSMDVKWIFKLRENNMDWIGVLLDRIMYMVLNKTFGTSIVMF